MAEYDQESPRCVSRRSILSHVQHRSRVLLSTLPAYTITEQETTHSCSDAVLASGTTLQTAPKFYARHVATEDLRVKPFISTRFSICTAPDRTHSTRFQKGSNTLARRRLVCAESTLLCPTNTCTSITAAVGLAPSATRYHPSPLTHRADGVSLRGPPFCSSGLALCCSTSPRTVHCSTLSCG